MRILVLEDTQERQEAFKDKFGDKHVLFITDDTKRCIEMIENNSSFDYIFLDIQQEYL